MSSSFATPCLGESHVAALDQAGERRHRLKAGERSAIDDRAHGDAGEAQLVHEALVRLELCAQTSAEMEVFDQLGVRGAGRSARLRERTKARHRQALRG